MHRKKATLVTHNENTNLNNSVHQPIFDEINDYYCSFIHSTYIALAQSLIPAASEHDLA